MERLEGVLGVAFCRWGCKLSQKLFVGKEYVLKHVRLKHAHVVEARRQEVCVPSPPGKGQSYSRGMSA
jgi:hypothetical protein